MKQRSSRLSPLFSRLVLAFVAMGLFFLGLYKLQERLFPARIVLEQVPFGLPATTKLDDGLDFIFDPDDGNAASTDRALFVKARDLAKINQTSSAKSLLNSVLVSSPEYLPALVLLSELLLTNDSSETEQVALLVSRASVIDPEHPRVLCLQAELFLSENNKTGAESRFREAAQNSPRFASARLGLAQIFLAEKRYAEASEELHAALSLSSPLKRQELYAMLVEAYRYSSQKDSAWAVLDYALAVFPYDPELLRMSGLLLESEGQIDSAGSIYRRILGIHPGDQAARKALQTLGRKQGSEAGGSSEFRTVESGFSGAMDVLIPLVEKNPDNVPLLYALGKMRYFNGDYRRAFADFQQVKLLDSSFEGITETLEITRIQWKGAKSLQSHSPVKAAKSKSPSLVPEISEELGHYLIKWGSTRSSFFHSYQKERFAASGRDGYKETIFKKSLREESILRFDESGLWGITVVITDTSHTDSTAVRDLFGKMIRRKTAISGRGQAIGETKCPGFKSFQGVIWEDRENFDLMAQFEGKQWQVRMVRLDRRRLDKPPSLCKVMPYLIEGKGRAPQPPNED